VQISGFIINEKQESIVQYRSTMCETNALTFFYNSCLRFPIHHLKEHEKLHILIARKSDVTIAIVEIFVGKVGRRKIVLQIL
jgi:hypothetical protein